MPHLDNASDRRTDVFLSCWCSGDTVALVFAITSAMQIDALAATSADGISPNTDYQSEKNNYLDTKNQCQEVDLTFIPMIVQEVGRG